MGLYKRTDEILAFVRDLKATWGSDPFAIAEKMDIRIVHRDKGQVGAYIVRMPDYPTMITITGKVSDIGSRMLCAHELGHAFLHSEQSLNRFNGTDEAVQQMTEYEANLFAVALLFNEDDFNRPFAEMTNHVLKMVLDYNIF